MFDDARFGLPLSLEEALSTDPSREAAQLAQLLREADGATQAQTRAPREGRRRVWRNTMAGLALATAVANSAAHAATPTPSLQGRWTMAPAASSFQEGVTGPAPDHATMTVSQDDPHHFTYELVERRGGAEVARGVYDLSFGDAASTTRVDGADLKVEASRAANGDVLIEAPPVGALRAVIRVLRTGPDTAVLEHDVEDAGRTMAVERISLVRTGGM